MNKFNFKIQSIILILLTIFISFSFGFQDWTEIVKKAKPAVVLVECLGDEGGGCEGSGFVINSRGDIVTCYHVMRGAYVASVQYYDDTYRSVVGILAADSINDIAIIRCESSEYPASFLELEDNLPAVGENVVVIGSPLDYNFSVTEGLVSAIRDNNIRKEILLNAPIAPGSSGSPVINNVGKVIGVITGSMEEDWYLMNFATSSSVILNMNTTCSIDIADWPGITGRPSCFMLLAREQWKNNKKAAFSLRSALEDYLDMAESFNPERRIWAKFYYKLGHFYKYLYLYEEAILSYKKAVDLDESCEEAHKGLGDCYVVLKRYDDAEESYQELVRLDPNNWYAQYRLGLSHFEQGHYRFAISRFKKTLVLYPTYAQVHFDLGRAYLAVDDKVAALDEYDYLHDNYSELGLELFDLIFEDEVPKWKKQYKNFFGEDDDR